MKIEIGGQRIGSGKKMNVDAKTYGRSTHDLSKTWRSSMSPGTLVPFMVLPILPGDTIDIDLDCIVKTHPTIGPLFGSFKVQLDVFEIPTRLYNSWLHNNKSYIGMSMEQVMLPQLKLEAKKLAIEDNHDNSQVNPSCILRYLGIAGIGTGEGSAPSIMAREFNAIPYLGYFDIFKNYYANQQEDNGYIIHRDVQNLNQTIDAVTYKPDASGAFTAVTEYPTVNPYLMVDQFAEIAITFDTGMPKTENDQIVIYRYDQPYGIMELFWEFEEIGDGRRYYNRRSTEPFEFQAWGYKTPGQVTITPPRLQAFPINQIDAMRSQILETSGGSTLVINKNSYQPYNFALQVNDAGYNTASQTQEGLLVKTYQSDVNNNWIRTEWVNAVADKSRVNTAAGSFTMDTLNMAQKVYNVLTRVALSGGSYNDWLEVTYTTEVLRKAEIPMYVGGLSKELVFEEIVSNAATPGQPLGQLAGQGRMSKKHKGGKIQVKPREIGYIMGIVSITPRVDYSQGNKWHTNLKTMDDYHKPEMDGIGFQDLITDTQAWWDTLVSTDNEITFRSRGKQPAWINYMTDVDETFGNFAMENNEMFMTLNRRYEGVKNGEMQDGTTYIDPSKYNFIFADTKLDAQNFWTQVGLDITARRKMSSKMIPNL